MTFYITVTIFVMTPLMNRFTSIIMDVQNLDEIHANLLIQSLVYHAS